MVVEASGISNPFRATNKRRLPTATAPKQRESSRMAQNCSVSQAPPCLLPQPGRSRSGWWFRAGIRSLLSPAVLTSSPRNPEALRRRCLINHCSNGSGSSSPPCWATFVTACSCSLTLMPREPICSCTHPKTCLPGA